MNEGNKNENILIFGAEGASEVLECMLKGSGYGVERLNEREELLNRVMQEESALLLFDFQTEAGSSTEALTFLTELRQSCNLSLIHI